MAMVVIADVSTMSQVGSKAMVTASAPTESPICDNARTARPIPTHPPTTLRRTVSGHHKPKHTVRGEAQRLKDGMFPDTVFDGHDGGCGQEHGHQKQTGPAEIARQIDQMDQVGQGLEA